jgi:hypothetical protein
VIRASQLALLATAIALTWTAGAREARADELATLDVDAKDDARTCDEADLLRAKIAERLGRDPFTRRGSDPEAKPFARLRVSYARNKLAWTAEIALLDNDGKRTGARTLTREGATCEPLVASVVFTVAVLLEELAPRGPDRPAPAPPVGPGPADDPWRDPPAPDVPRSPPPAVTTPFDASLGAAGAVGGAPAPSVGGELVVGLDVKRLRVELGGRMYLPASSDGDVAVRTRLVYGRVAPCYGWEVLSACFVAAVGSVSGEATGDGVASSSLDGQVYAAGGFGALSRIFVVSDRVFLRAAIDILFPVSRVGFDVGDLRVWTVPLVSAASVVGVGVRLP